MGNDAIGIMLNDVSKTGIISLQTKSVSFSLIEFPFSQSTTIVSE
jgi:hypothetical protein